MKKTHNNIVKFTILLTLLLNLHVSAKDAWGCLVDNEKNIIREFLKANYWNGASIDTTELVRYCHWFDDSTSYIKYLQLHVGNMEEPSILPDALFNAVEELGDLEYLIEFDLNIIDFHQIKHLWNSIDKNDRLETITGDNLITLPKTIAGCDNLRNITLGDKLEHLPDEFLELNLLPYTDTISKGIIDLCACDDNTFQLSTKQKEWVEVKDFNEYKKRFCDSLSDSAVVAELFRRNGYKNVDINKAIRYSPNSSRVDSVIIKGDEYPNIKRLNFNVDFESLRMLKYIEISNIDTLFINPKYFVRYSHTSDTLEQDSLQEININNITEFSFFNRSSLQFVQTFKRDNFKVFHLRNCNLKMDDVPDVLVNHDIDPKKLDLCGNDSIVFDNRHKIQFKELGYNIETYEDYEKYFCNSNIIEPTFSTTTDFNVSFANKQLQITLPQSMKIEKMKLLTVDGKIVKQFSVPTGTVMPSQFTLELNDTLSAGFYIVSLDVAGKQFQKKFVVR